MNINNVWEQRLIAEVSGYLKSRVQGKMLRINEGREYLFWKANDKQVMRIETKTGRKLILDVKFSRPFDFLSDFKSNKDGSKLCVLSRYGQIKIFIIDKNTAQIQTIVKKLFNRSKELIRNVFR